MQILTKLWKWLRGAALPVWVGLNVLVAGITVFSGWGGNIDPMKMPFAGVANLTFPIWFSLSALLLIVDLILCRWASIAPLAAILATLKPFLVFCPLNFGSHQVKPEEENRAFKVLSYNILSFVDETGLSDSDCNRTMEYILQADADVVALLEYENQGPIAKFVPRAQLDSFRTVYPYHSLCSRGTALFSKRPILHIEPPFNTLSRSSIEAFRTQVAGRPVNIFAVHLESIGLNDDDKELYRDITDRKVVEDAEAFNVSEVRAQLIDKLYSAFRYRNEQALYLRNYVEELGGDIIVCGDFNDVPGCRTIKILEKTGLKDVYAEVGLGPTITFALPHFIFRIDHVLYRGAMRPVSIERGNVRSSDHYPMLTTFVWDEDTTPQRGTND